MKSSIKYQIDFLLEIEINKLIQLIISRHISHQK